MIEKQDAGLLEKSASQYDCEHLGETEKLPFETTDNNLNTISRWCFTVMVVPKYGPGWSECTSCWDFQMLSILCLCKKKGIPIISPCVWCDIGWC